VAAFLRPFFRAFLPGRIATRVVTCAFLLAGLLAESSPARQVADPAVFVRSERGGLPILLSAPHGGREEPAYMADRTCSTCVTVTDAFTTELTDEIAWALEERTGRRPWVVASLLRRTKLDPNREIGEAADGDPHAEAVWHVYHGTMAAWRDSIAVRFGTGLVLDIHGHGHAIPRLELGYLASAGDLRATNTDLNALRGTRNSMNHLIATHPAGMSFADVIRGPESLGALFEASGYPSVPSPSSLTPMAGEAYFSGGYITEQYGSRHGGVVDAVQLEANRNGVRSTEAERRAFGRAAADVLLAFFRIHYGMDLEALSTGLDGVRPSAAPNSPDTAPGVSGLSIWPNPVPSDPAGPVRIGFRMDSAGPARIIIHDVLGRAMNEMGAGLLEPGPHILTWEPGGLPAGLYLVRVTTPSGTASRPIILL
jgi:N-formylglutamate amidohydrolase